jgi:hypothetical protein
MSKEQIRREDLRKAVRAYLCDRIGTALRCSSIHHGLSKEWEATETEVREALHFLISTQPRQVEALPDSDGATIYYRITADGMLVHERSL